MTITDANTLLHNKIRELEIQIEAQRAKHKAAHEAYMDRIQQLPGEAVSKVFCATCGEQTSTDGKICPSCCEEYEETWSRDLSAAKQCLAELNRENARLRAALKIISRTGEEQNALLRSNKYVFTRFPRSTPPETDAERWEALAFINALEYPGDGRQGKSGAG